MKCMKLVLLLFNDNKLLLNHTFVFLIVVLISFMNSLGLGLVTIELMSSAERIEWILYYYLYFL